jgi:hypothetical protein
MYVYREKKETNMHANTNIQTNFMKNKAKEHIKVLIFWFPFCECSGLCTFTILGASR